MGSLSFSSSRAGRLRNASTIAITVKPAPISVAVNQLCPSLFGIQRLLRVRIVERQQRPLRELHREEGQPDSAHADRDHEIQPTHSEMKRRECRSYKPVDVDKPQREYDHD